MIITVNGEKQDIAADNLLLATLLARNDVSDDASVSVQRNGEFVDPGEYARTKLADGDEVDFLYFLGGGAA